MEDYMFPPLTLSRDMISMEMTIDFGEPEGYQHAARSFFLKRFSDLLRRRGVNAASDDVWVTVVPDIRGKLLRAYWQPSASRIYWENGVEDIPSMRAFDGSLMHEFRRLIMGDDESDSGKWHYHESGMKPYRTVTFEWMGNSPEDGRAYYMQKNDDMS